MRRLICIQFTVWLLAVFAGVPRLLAAEAATPREKLEKAFVSLEQADAAIPAGTWDPVTIVKSVGPDAGKLFTWVQQNTRWAPYRGVLRGPVGVLMDRTGNSLDRSLLLAELLKTMNVHTRLTHGTLSGEQCKTLLEQIKKSQKTPPPPVDEAAPVKGDAGRAVGMDKIGENLAQNVADVSGPITAAIGKASSPTDQSQIAVAALADHWWLQRQDGDLWVDLDVTVPDAKPGTAIAPAGETFPFDQPGGPTLDKDLWHTVRIAVVAEQWADAKLTQNTALSRTVRTSQVVGETLYLTHTPLDWKANPSAVDTPDAQSQAFQQALTPTEWVPTLRLLIDTANEGGIRPDGSIDPKPQLDAMTRAGGSTGKGAGAAAAALDDVLGDKPTAAVAPPASVFTAEWIDYTFHAPGQPDQTIRRQLFDLIGPAARAAGVRTRPEIADAARADAAMALSGRTDILLLPCQLSGNFVGHHLLESLVVAKPALLRALDAMQKPGGADAETNAAPPCPASLYGTALARHLFSANAPDWFIGHANVFTDHTYIRFTPDKHQLQCEATDLVANDVAVRPSSSADAFAVRVNQGILDTVAEQSFLPPHSRITSAARSLTAAVTQSLPLTTLHTAAEAQQLHLSPDQLARIVEELKAGRIIVLPSAAVRLDDEDRFAWWSVDPSTGRTMGMGETGWGAAMSEYAAKIQQWIETNKRFVCIGAGVATAANIIAQGIGVGELTGDSLDVIQAALDAACGG